MGGGGRLRARVVAVVVVVCCMALFVAAPHGQPWSEEPDFNFGGSDYSTLGWNYYYTLGGYRWVGFTINDWIPFRGLESDKYLSFEECYVYFILDIHFTYQQLREQRVWPSSSTIKPSYFAKAS